MANTDSTTSTPKVGDIMVLLQCDEYLRRAGYAPLQVVQVLAPWDESFLVQKVGVYPGYSVPVPASWLGPFDEPSSSPATPQKIDVGSVVVLKSGGPNMTVVGIQENRVSTLWFDGGNDHEGIFPMFALVLSEANL